MEIINFKKKKMKLFTNELQKAYENAKICFICKEKFNNKHAKDKEFRIVRDQSRYAGEYRGASRRILNLMYGVPK